YERSFARSSPPWSPLVNFPCAAQERRGAAVGVRRRETEEEEGIVDADPPRPAAPGRDVLRSSRPRLRADPRPDSATGTDAGLRRRSDPGPDGRTLLHAALARAPQPAGTRPARHPAAARRLCARPELPPGATRAGRSLAGRCAGPLRQ